MTIDTVAFNVDAGFEVRTGGAGAESSAGWSHEKRITEPPRLERAHPANMSYQATASDGGRDFCNEGGTSPGVRRCLR
jgi:hypothetical protein